MKTPERDQVAAQGLIWGCVQLDWYAPDVEMFGRLTAAMHRHAALAPEVTGRAGPAIFGQARLQPSGNEALPAPPITLDCSASLMATDLRLYEAPAAGETPGERLARAQRSGRARDLAAVDGDFAAAFWVEERYGLDLLRDAMGVRPLFFAHRPGVSVAFCSLIQPLLDAGSAGSAPNPVVLARKARLLSESGTQTHLRDVQRVPAAHRVRITAQGLRLLRYWVPGDDRCAPLATRRKDAVPARLRAEIDCAVRKRLPRQGPVATHCSGGLDSSTVTALAAEAVSHRNQRVLGCFFAAQRRADVDATDATPHVQALKQSTPNLDIKTIDLQDLRTFLLGDQRPDLPMSEDAATNPWCQSAAAAAETGASVILSGFGGDETASFKGQGGVTGALLGLRFRTLRRLLSDESRATGRSPRRILARELAARMLPKRLVDRIRIAAGAAPSADYVLSRALTAKARRWTDAPNQPWTSSGYRRHLLTDGRLAAVAETLAINAARHGVAVAFPYYDRRLIAFCQNLSATHCWRGGQSRSAMRTATSGLLPDMIRTQPQKSPDDGAGVLRLVELRSEIEAALDRLEKTDAAAVFDLAAVKALLNRWPSETDARRDAAALAETGAARNPAPMLATVPLTMARFLARKTS